MIECLKRRSGLELRLSSDIERLVLDIEVKTGEHIGVNTMKRLLGYIKDERQTRESTLDIIARYMGYDNWKMASKIELSRFSSSFGYTIKELRMSRLSVGSRVRFTYNPEREVIMRYIGNQRFVVEKSVNSKLLKGDVLEIWHMIRRYPLFVTSVVRDGEDLGPFTAGKVGGLTALRMLKETE